MTIARLGPCRLRRQKLAGLFGEVKQDGVRIEHGHIAIDNRRNFGIRVNRQVFRLVLLTPAGIDRDRLVGKPGLFEKQPHLGRIWRTAKIELQHHDTS